MKATKDQLLDAGYYTSNNGWTWESPNSGMILSFEEARQEYAEVLEEEEDED